MLDIPYILNYLGPLQWIVAIAFVPLVCWQFCSLQSVFCRWCALLSGYAIQIGFFLLLDDVGFQVNLLILISSVAAYFWITTTVAIWPVSKVKQQPVKAASDESSEAAA